MPGRRQRSDLWPGRPDGRASASSRVPRSRGETPASAAEGNQYSRGRRRGRPGSSPGGRVTRETLTVLDRHRQRTVVAIAGRPPRSQPPQRKAC